MKLWWCEINGIVGYYGSVAYTTTMYKKSFSGIGVLGMVHFRGFSINVRHYKFLRIYSRFRPLAFLKKYKNSYIHIFVAFRNTTLKMYMYWIQRHRRRRFSRQKIKQVVVLVLLLYIVIVVAAVVVAVQNNN